MISAFQFPAAILMVCSSSWPGALAIWTDNLNFRDLDSVPDYRTNLCGITEGVQNGSIKIEDALRGLHINAVTPLYDPPWFDEPINNTDADKMAGFHVDLLSTIASRGGFTYTIYSHPLSSFQPEFSWTQYFKAATEKFDISMDWASTTNERTSLGLRAPTEFLDLSLVPARYSVMEEPSIAKVFWDFTKPLTPELWGIFFSISALTSLLYVAAEGNSGTDFQPHWPLREKVLRSLWLGIAAFTGAGGFAPKTALGSILALSYSFVKLLTMAAYTASLAATLTVKASLAGCTSFDQCISDGLRVCVWRGTAGDSLLSDRYPNLVQSGQLVRCADDPWKCVQRGECSLAVTSLLPLQLEMGKAELNADCTMNRVGASPLVSIGGGWLCKVDHSYKCTSLVIDSLNSHMMALQASGELDAMRTELVENSKEVVCSADQSQLKTGVSGMPVLSLAGVMMIHGMVWCAVFLLVVCWRAKAATIAREHQAGKAVSEQPTGEQDVRAMLLTMQNRHSEMQEDFAKVIASLQPERPYDLAR